MTYLPTFAKFVRTDWARDHPGDCDTARQWAVYNDRVYREVQDVLQDPFIVAQRGQGIVAEELAKGILEAVFDAAWVEEKFPLADERDPANPRWIVKAYRRRELARRVYEFQSHPWFQDFVTYTRTNEVTSALFEADVLHTLMRMPGTVTRGTTTGSRGEDFDVHLELGTAGQVPIEVKCKQDGTPYSTATIRNTVKTAIKQLPKGHTGWLFLQLPASWVGPRLEEEYAQTLHDAIRQTSRIGAVLTAIDKPHLDVDRGTFRLNRDWHLLGHPDVPDPLWKAALLLKQLLDGDMDHFAPHAPF
ncbi:hypothetical protein [Kitasatospora sp. NPDC002965]|uniref:hypothetical protein n=1 Tax=Kitasatospora sp. NPDC002965 TaxID=3154775 RepID=UPI0033A8F813